MMKTGVVEGCTGWPVGELAGLRVNWPTRKPAYWLTSFRPLTSDLRQRGSVLIYVVWVVLLLSIFAGAVGMHALNALSLSERMVGQLCASQLAQGGRFIIAAALANDATAYSDGPTDPWANDPMRFRERRIAGGTLTITSGVPGANGQLRYGVSDEEAKLNLNTASREMLQALVQRVGKQRDEDAKEIAAAIVDWRDPDTDETDGGAENFYYQTRQPGYDCHDAPFEHLEELLLVKGMTPRMYRKLAPHVTTYGSGRLNVNTAGRDELSSLGFSEAGRSGLELFRDGEDTQPGTGDDRYFDTISTVAPSLEHLIPPEDLAMLQRLVREERIDTRASAFAALIEATCTREVDRMSVRVIMDREGRELVWTEQ